MESIADDETLDAILDGRLRIIQPRDGYRFALDAILLARFARVRSRDRVLELGGGCGVVSALVALLHSPREVVTLELQRELVEMARRNGELNRLRSLSAVCADLRARKIPGLTPASFDLVLANPPYRARNTGRASPVPARRIARQESGASLKEFIAAAARYARHGGRAAFIFTAARSAELIGELRAARLEPKRIRMVHPRAELPASNIMVEARKGAGVEAAVQAPLIVYARPGEYSSEARAMLGMEAPG